MASVNANTAPFEALYAARFGIPSVPAIEAVFTIAADLLARKSGIAERETLAVPTTFTFNTYANFHHFLSQQWSVIQCQHC